MVWKISLVIEPDEDNFHGFCPFLKGLHTGGKTKEETLMYLGEALSAYMRSIIKHDDLALGWDNAERCSLLDVLEQIKIEEL